MNNFENLSFVIRLYKLNKYEFELFDNNNKLFINLNFNLSSINLYSLATIDQELPPYLKNSIFLKIFKTFPRVSLQTSKRNFELNEKKKFIKNSKIYFN